VCVDSWRSVVETEGANSRSALVWRGRADEALRVAIHFGLVDPEDGRRRLAIPTQEVADLRVLTEPDGEQQD
jgi:hypothetical protein